MADLAKIVDDLSKLTVLQAAELAKMLEEKWGVSAAAPVAVAAGPAAGAPPRPTSTPRSWFRQRSIGTTWPEHSRWRHAAWAERIPIRQ